VCEIHRVVGAGWKNRAQLSDVALANIEALASGEGEIIIDGTCHIFDTVQRCVWLNADKVVEYWVNGEWVIPPEIGYE